MVDSAENCTRMQFEGCNESGCRSRFQRVVFEASLLPTLGKKIRNICLTDKVLPEVESPFNLIRNDHRKDISHLSQHVEITGRLAKSNRVLGKATFGKLYQNSTKNERKLRIHNRNNWDLGSRVSWSEPVCSNFRKNSAKLPRRQHYEEKLVGISKFRGTNKPTMLICVSMIIIILANSNSVAEGVDCFKCSSRNGSNPACEDPFHNLNTTRITSPVLPDPPPNVIYHTPCYAGKKGREGLFPASACIKLTGTFDATGETLVVRHCALDSGTLTQDTELARMSHCGKFNFDGDSLKGCVLACPEDACNSVSPSILRKEMPLATALILMLAASIQMLLV